MFLKIAHELALQIHGKILARSGCRMLLFDGRSHDTGKLHQRIVVTESRIILPVRTLKIVVRHGVNPVLSTMDVKRRHALAIPAQCGQKLTGFPRLSAHFGWGVRTNDRQSGRQNLRNNLHQP
jgi:hypothetical protein